MCLFVKNNCIYVKLYFIFKYESIVCQETIFFGFKIKPTHIMIYIYKKNGDNEQILSEFRENKCKSDF